MVMLTSDLCLMAGVRQQLEAFKARPVKRDRRWRGPVDGAETMENPHAGLETPRLLLDRSRRRTSPMPPSVQAGVFNIFPAGLIARSRPTGWRRD